jgi:hypothetical protein
MIDKQADIYKEIDELHRDCMNRLNRMAWAVADVMVALELAEEQTHDAINVCRDGAGSAGSITGNTSAPAAVSNTALRGRDDPGCLGNG